MTRLKVLVVACVSLALGTYVAAALIGLGPQLGNSQTYTSFEQAGFNPTIHFDAGTRVLTMHVTDVGDGSMSRFDTIFAPNYDSIRHKSDLSPDTNSVSINLKVMDSYGLSVIENGSPAFSLNARVDVNGIYPSGPNQPRSSPDRLEYSATR